MTRIKHRLVAAGAAATAETPHASAAWFWPMGLAGRMFSRVMSPGAMQRRILEHNFFVERWLPRGVVRQLSEQEIDRYRGAQPTAELRAGVAQLPRHIITASGRLAE